MTSSDSRAADRAELIRALAVLCEAPGTAAGRVATALGIEQPSAVEHTEVFLHQLPPYASIYLDLEGKIGGEAREVVAGFWRAVGVMPPPDPDHLSALLGLWAALLASSDEPAAEPERSRLTTHAATALVTEHLASWLPAYLARVRELADAVYAGWAELLTQVVAAAVDRDATSAHLAAAVSRPVSSGELVPYLLTPVRSGLVLTKADLYRAGRELALGIRIGERSYALDALLSQDAAGVLRWMAAEARRQAGRVGSSVSLGAATAVWTERAGVTAALLDALG